MLHQLFQPASPSSWPLLCLSLTFSAFDILSVCLLFRTLSSSRALVFPDHPESLARWRHTTSPTLPRRSCKPKGSRLRLMHQLLQLLLMQQGATRSHSSVSSKTNHSYMADSMLQKIQASGTRLRSTSPSSLPPKPRRKSLPDSMQRNSVHTSTSSTPSFLRSPIISIRS